MAGLPSPDVPVTPQELYREFSKSGVMNYWMAEQSKQIRIRSIVWEVCRMPVHLSRDPPSFNDPLPVRRISRQT